MFLSTVVARADAIPKVGLMDREIPAFEDWDWYLRAALVTIIGTIPEALTQYRIHKENSNSKEFLIGERKTSEKHLARCEVLPAEKRRLAKRNFYIHLAAVAYKEENHQECAAFLKQALAFDRLAVLNIENIRYTITAFGSKMFVQRLRQMKRQLFYTKSTVERDGDPL